VNPQRLTILVAGALTVTGCGVAAGTAGGLRSGSAGTGSTAVVAPAHVDSAAITTPAPSASPPTATPAPPSPPPPPQDVVVTDQDQASASTFEVAIVNRAGAVVASVRVPADARWTVGSGSGGAYWVTAGKLEHLSASGSVSVLATVPATQSSRVVISPDGSQWAYATSSQDGQTGVITNRLYRGGPGRPAQLIAQRIADPKHRDPDTPGMWQYYLQSWTAQGILIERQPAGGCGCGLPFDMQMSAGYVAFINPVTGAATTLPASPSCPLSGVAPDGSFACFRVSTTGASSALRFAAGGQVTHQYTLSGLTDGGDAVLNGSSVAYATVPASAGGCGAADWRPQTTLHLMDVATGAARVVGGRGLQPMLWLDDGTLLASRSVVTGGVTVTSTVDVDVATGVTRALGPAGLEVVGLA
jgi:hypothetical protein